MSCHSIGKGLNIVAKSILNKYEQGEISFDATFDLLKTVRDSIWVCDGNVDEAIQCMDCRCGHCLESKEDLIRCYNVPDKFKYAQSYLEKNCWHDTILNDRVCPECLEKLYLKE